MYWSTACRAWDNVVSATWRTPCAGSDFPPAPDAPPLDASDDPVGCFSMYSLLDFPAQRFGKTGRSLSKAAGMPGTISVQAPSTTAPIGAVGRRPHLVADLLVHLPGVHGLGQSFLARLHGDRLRHPQRHVAQL